MTAVTEVTADEAALEEVDLALPVALAVALVVGGGLVLAARVGAVALLAAVAVAQALFAAVWVFGTVMPGRRGALIIAVLAGAGADVTISVWPHGRLGTLLPVLAVAVPVLFVHQLMRGAVRVHVVSSLSATALLVLAEVSLAALPQLRHEFGSKHGGAVASAAAAAVAAARSARVPLR